MSEKKATRVGYGEALVALGAENDKVVVLDADLSCSTMTNGFAKAYPDRFFDCGIAEANMVTMAAGLSSTGLIPFCSTFAVFASRCYEQIRNGVCYPKLNVKFAFTHAGITVGEDGATHQAIEDIAIMRALPGMTILCPCDAEETDARFAPPPRWRVRSICVWRVWQRRSFRRACRLKSARQTSCARAAMLRSSPAV